jgi:hypothetical protein
VSSVSWIIPRREIMNKSNKSLNHRSFILIQCEDNKQILFLLLLLSCSLILLPWSNTITQGKLAVDIQVQLWSTQSSAWTESKEEETSNSCALMFPWKINSNIILLTASYPNHLLMKDIDLSFPHFPCDTRHSLVSKNQCCDPIY